MTVISQEELFSIELIRGTKNGCDFWLAIVEYFGGTEANLMQVPS
jgi:hypothetical protein